MSTRRRMPRRAGSARPQRRTASPGPPGRAARRPRLAEIDKLCVRLDLLVRAAVEPEPQGLDLTATCELVPVPEGDPAGLGEIAARVRVGERLVRTAVPLAPARRARQVHGEQVRMVALELAPEEIAEQMVVAVPLAAIVERDDECVRACEGVERIGCAARGEHRIAQGRRHPVENRRREQEPF